MVLRLLATPGSSDPGPGSSEDLQDCGNKSEPGKDGNAIFAAR
jgi:hypothetical protein